MVVVEGLIAGQRSDLLSLFPWLQRPGEATSRPDWAQLCLQRHSVHFSLNFGTEHLGQSPLVRQGQEDGQEDGTSEILIS